MENQVRQKDNPISSFRLSACSWRIPTISSAPRTHPNELTDTIHLYSPVSKKKRYLYATIDLYTRMAYAKVYDELRPGPSVQTILKAQAKLGFKFKTVQTDNGLEFGKHFAERLQAKGIVIRHTRLHRPNDNAHIERFNRTIQEECTGPYYLESESLDALNMRISNYLDYYNHRRIRLGLKYMTPM
ncbi:MAG: integrase core domain-containing protein, partial [Candidatus Saccharibacteria bacterium]|nr:integrase core domain-containing protein [Candidatus Saccharibacteria bacterium]